jgi:hypothetical protein
VCEAGSADPPSAESAADGPIGATEQARQKRLAVGAVVAFASAVVLTVSLNWPSPCERTARHLCEGTKSSSCGALLQRIEAKASPKRCSQEMAHLREIDATSKGDARRYRYLGVIKSLVGGAHK